MTKTSQAKAEPQWFTCPKWQTRSIVPPCAARIANASAGTVPGETAPDYAYCLTCPDSVVVQDMSEPKQNRKGRLSKGRYDRKPANKFGLAYICRQCANIVRAEHKATEWERK